MHWLLADILVMGLAAVVTLGLILIATYIGCWLADKTRRQMMDAKKRGCGAR